MYSFRSRLIIVVNDDRICLGANRRLVVLDHDRLAVPDRDRIVVSGGDKLVVVYGAPPPANDPGLIAEPDAWAASTASASKKLICMRNSTWSSLISSRRRRGWSDGISISTDRTKSGTHAKCQVSPRANTLPPL